MPQYQSGDRYPYRRNVVAAVTAKGTAIHTSSSLRDLTPTRAMFLMSLVARWYDDGISCEVEWTTQKVTLLGGRSCGEGARGIPWPNENWLPS